MILFTGKHVVLRYVLLGITCLMILLVGKICFSVDPSLPLLEKEMQNDPCTVYHKLCKYWDVTELKNEADVLYRQYLRHSAKSRCEGSLISDSLVRVLIHRCDSLGETAISARYRKLMGESLMQRQVYPEAIIYYEQAYSMLQAELAKIKQKEEKEFMFYWGGLIILSFCLVGCLWSHFLHRTQFSRVQKQKTLWQRKYESRQSDMEASLNTIMELTQQLEKKTQECNKLKDNQSDEQEAKKNRVSASLVLLRHSEYTVKFYKAAVDARVKLNKEDWECLIELIRNEFPFLLDKLYQTPKVTDTERRICLLMLLGLGTLEISNLLGLKTSSISSAKKSLFEKLTGTQGSAKELSQEIMNIIYYSL